jgi:hypothetical protein
MAARRAPDAAPRRGLAKAVVIGRPGLHCCLVRKLRRRVRDIGAGAITRAPRRFRYFPASERFPTCRGSEYLVLRPAALMRLLPPILTQVPQSRPWYVRSPCCCRLRRAVAGRIDSPYASPAAAPAATAADGSSGSITRPESTPEPAPSAGTSPRRGHRKPRWPSRALSAELLPAGDTRSESARSYWRPNPHHVRRPAWRPSWRACRPGTARAIRRRPRRPAWGGAARHPPSRAA